MSTSKKTTVAERAARKAEIDRAALYVGGVRSRNVVALFGREEVRVTIGEVAAVAFQDGRWTQEEGISLMRALMRLGLVRKIDHHYALTLTLKPATNQAIAAALAAEMRANGDSETFVDVLATTSAALARFGLHGITVEERLEKLYDTDGVRYSHLAGRPRMVLRS